jgi:hypothetical protein
MKAPVGTVSGPIVLAWVPLDRAERYRGTVFDAEGSILFRAETRDSVLPLPDSLTPAVGRSYFWKVEADLGWDQWVSSGLVEFRLDHGKQDQP